MARRRLTGLDDFFFGSVQQTHEKAGEQFLAEEARVDDQPQGDTTPAEEESRRGIRRRSEEERWRGRSVAADDPDGRQMSAVGFLRRDLLRRRR